MLVMNPYRKDTKSLMNYSNGNYKDVPDAMTDDSVKKGNVLALLNTLYTSGFAVLSPNQPMLKGRTMHTLYAFSFLVYFANCLCDWIHVCCTLKGWVTSFPLETWLVVALVTTVVGGSMLTGLLLVLCVENAFAHRLGVTPYRSGFSIIFEAIVEWVQAFNNFRMSFLIMALHDCPMTLLNFFFIASCRCAGPKTLPWSLMLSSASSVVSLVWRLTMLYFSYRRMLCPMKQQAPVTGVAVPQTPKEHFISATTTAGGGRLAEYDECWPVRWARWQVFGEDLLPGVTPRERASFDIAPKHFYRGRYLFSGDPLVCGVPVFRTALDGILLLLFHLARVLRVIACIILTLLVYIAFLASCCLPCIAHYTCRKNSFFHRHKFSRSFVRYASHTYHYTVFFVSLILSVGLIGMNIVLLSSVHVLGSNQIPPEINQVCIHIDPRSQTIFASVLPTPLFPIRNKTLTCKPIWEDVGLGLGVQRRPAGPWQTRKRMSGGDMIAVSTQVTLNRTDEANPFLVLRYDHAILKQLGAHSSHFYRCLRGQQSKWDLVPDTRQLHWPFFRGCRQDWVFERARLIECDEYKPRTLSDYMMSGRLTPYRRTRHARHKHRKHRRRQ